MYDEALIKNNNYFLKETILGADYVILYRNEKIRWLQELGIEGMRLRPKAILGRNPFTVLERKDDSIFIELAEWIQFVYEISSVFRNNKKLREKSSYCVNNELKTFDMKVRLAEKEYRENGTLSSKDVNGLFEGYSYTDAFSIFNNLIPLKYHERKFEEISIPRDVVRIDDFLVSLVEPHRNLVRKEKLKLALKYHESNDVSEIELDEFIEKYLPYDDFDKWIFDRSRIENKSILLREIRQMTRIMSAEQIEDEIKTMKEKRTQKLNKRYKSMCIVSEYCDKKLSKEETMNILESLEFLAVSTTEEEYRHMTVCRFYILIGDILEKLKLDPARTGVDDIIKTINYMW